MPYPEQTFATVDQLISYINNNIITNGSGEIDALKHNNVENGLANFIKTLPFNHQTATVKAGGGNEILSTSITVWITAAPTSIQWPDNIYNEYVIVNATDEELPFHSGYFYRDVFMDIQTGVAARSVLRMAKASTGQWVQINNTPAVGSLPSQTGNAGRALFTNGTSAQWKDPKMFLDSSNFESDGKTALLPSLNGFAFSIFWNQASQYLIENVDWTYVTDGFEITRTDFDANTSPVDVIIDLKGKR